MPVVSTKLLSTEPDLRWANAWRAQPYGMGTRPRRLLAMIFIAGFGYGHLFASLPMQVNESHQPDTLVFQSSVPLCSPASYADVGLV